MNDQHVMEKLAYDNEGGEICTPIDTLPKLADFKDLSIDVIFSSNYKHEQINKFHDIMEMIGYSQHGTYLRPDGRQMATYKPKLEDR